MKKTENLLLLASLLLMIVMSCNKHVDDLDNSINNVLDSVQFHTLLVDGNKLIIKEENGIYYFSEDLPLYDEQFNYLKHRSSKSDNSTMPRGAITNEFSKRWPDNTVYYSVTGSQKIIDNVQTAVNSLAQRVNITFVNNTSGQSNYLYFNDANFYHNAIGLGMPTGEAVLLVDSLNNDPVVFRNAFLRALGRTLEIHRPDRDNYVDINWTNIQPAELYNFNVLPEYVGIGDFDFETGQNYAWNRFAVNNSIYTIKRKGSSNTTSPTYSRQWQLLSAGDIASLKALYEPIEGPAAICSTGNYSLSYIPDGGSVSWSIISGPALISGSGNSITVNSNGGSGNVMLKATIAYGGNSYDVTKSISVGGSIILDGIWTQSTTGSTNPNLPLPFIALAPDRCSVQTAEWEVSPSSAMISYNAGFPCENNNNTGVTITFFGQGSYTVKTRVRNSCGLWSNWAFKTISVQ